ncbi:MAG: prepilin peptidase [Eggerthellaceae bacterium]|nr:prepilin peptidase [Eggerthellaceae bacterium]
MEGLAISAGTPMVIAYILAGILGACIGSFLNVVIYRLPEGMSLARPGSHCPHCGEKIAWYDNVPILSWLILGGKCRNCHEPITPRYFIVELLSAAIWMGCVWAYADNIILLVLACIALSICLCICFIDWEHMFIPDSLQVALGIVALAVVCLDIVAQNGTIQGDTGVFVGTGITLLEHLIGLAFAAVVFFGVSFVMGKKMHREVLGGGDIKFALITGLLLGWRRFLLMMLISSLTAVVGMLIKTRQERKKAIESGDKGPFESPKIPFAPYLVIGFIISVVLGKIIVAWYIGLFM